MAERRRRLTRAATDEALAMFLSLPITVDGETAMRAFGRVTELMRAERLTAYDATYLELAMRRGLPLASRDRALCRAAQAVGVALA